MRWRVRSGGWAGDGDLTLHALARRRAGIYLWGYVCWLQLLLLLLLPAAARLAKHVAGKIGERQGLLSQPCGTTLLQKGRDGPFGNLPA